MRFRYILHISLLLLLFSGSILLRERNIDKPLGRHHEWITAHTLVTLSIWEKEGLITHHFSPIYTFSGKANTNLELLGGVKDQNGRCYYTSYPPFAFLLPYFIFHPLGITPNVMSLQLLGLVIHFICAFGIFLLLYQLYDKRIGKETFLPAFIAFALYCYSYGNLWFHMNLWFCDILMQVFFIYGTLLYCKIRNGTGTGIHHILLGLVAFLAVYTEWLGLLMVIVFAISEGIRILRKKTNYRLLIVLCGATLLALTLTIWQYSSINGLSAFLEAAKAKYLIRSGYQNRNISEYGFNILNPASYEKMDGNYNGNYLTLINLLGILGILFIVISIYRRKYFVNQQERRVLFYIILPVVLHHVIFFNFNIVHDFSTLKTAFFLITLIAIFSQRILLFFSSLPVKLSWIGSVGLTVIIGIKCFESALLYKKNYDATLIMPPYEVLGQAIRAQAPVNELVIINGELCPELMYYSGRNMAWTQDTTRARDFLSRGGYSKAFFFDIKSGVLKGVYPL
jgi:hypothetical protein